jgi:hypothetical protein
MGGNALKLKGINPKRIPDSEKNNLIKTVSDALLTEKIFKWILPVKSFRQKQDHGDLDLIGELNLKNLEPDNPWHLKAKKALNSKEAHWNKPVVSLEYQGFQIDLTGRESYEKAKTHLEFSHYSPLGNILGRMIRRTGAKWGINGLEYQIKEKDSPEAQVLRTINLTNNIDHILSLCGLNPKPWHYGFDSEEDIFSFACQSHYFNKELFAIENLNHTHRKRDRTRPDYHQWLNYIGNSDIINKCSWKPTESIQEYSQRIQHFQLILDREFPKAKLLETIKEQRERATYISQQKEEKFNGELISNWCGLKGPKLGEFIKNFKESQGLQKNEELIKWILKHDKDFIKSSVLDYKTRQQDKPNLPEP